MAAASSIIQRQPYTSFVPKVNLKDPLSQIIEKVGRIADSLIFPNQTHLSKLSVLETKVEEASQLLKRCAVLFKRRKSCPENLLDEVVRVNLSLELLQEKKSPFRANPNFKKMLVSASKICGYLALSIKNFSNFHRNNLKFEAFQEFSLPPFAKTFYQKTIDGIEVVNRKEVKDHPNVVFVKAKDGFQYVEKHSKFDEKNGPSTEPAILCATSSCESIVQTAGVVSIEGGVVTYVLPKYSKDLFKTVIANRLTKASLLKYGSDILGGLKFLHERDVAHLDTKLENAFVTNEGRVVLGDVELTEAFGLLAHAGTRFAVAPEGVSGPVSDKRDMWAFGVLLFQALARDGFDQNVHDTFSKKDVKRRCRRLDPDGFWQKIMKDCLKTNPKNRPTAAALFEKVQEKMRISRSQGSK